MPPAPRRRPHRVAARAIAAVAAAVTALSATAAATTTPTAAATTSTATAAVASATTPTAAAVPVADDSAPVLASLPRPEPLLFRLDAATTSAVGFSYGPAADLDTQPVRWWSLDDGRSVAAPFGAPVPVPSGDHPIHSGGDWTLTLRQAAATGDEPTVHLLTRDGSDRVVPGHWSAATPGASAADATTVVFRDAGGIAVVDLASATARVVADPGAGDDDGVVLGPSRVYAVTTKWGTSPTQHIRWFPRSTADTDPADTGTADLAGRVERWWPLGDGLAAVTLAADGSAPGFHFDVAGVDLAPGTAPSARLGQPLLRDAMSVLPTGDGRLVANTADTPSGRIRLVTPGGGAAAAGSARDVLTLPTLRRSVRRVSLSGSRLVADLAEYQQPAPAQDLRSTTLPAAPAAGPAPAWSPVAGVPAGSDPGRVQWWTAGDVTAVSLRGPDFADRWVTTLRWPGGSRTVVGSTLEPVAPFRGGVYVQVPSDAPGGSIATAVEAARGGPVPAALTGPGTVVDGTRAWVGPDAAGVLRGTDSTGATPTRTVVTSDRSCRLGQAAGRWLLLDCATGPVAVDSLGVYPQWPVPRADHDWSGPRLGDGFVADVVMSPDGTGPTTLRVLDLTTGHRQHTYGPLVDLPGQPADPLALDDAGGHRLAYLDRDAQIRLPDLGWLGHAALPDVHAPVLRSLTGSARLVATTALDFSWSYLDPATADEPATGTASYDVRLAVRPRGAATYQPWRELLQGVPQTGVGLTGTPGSDTCLSVRARDRRGNTSAWSPPRCSLVDGTPPVLTALSVGPRVTAGGVLPIRYGARDDTGVASYDVAYRSAPPGGGLGGWVFPRAWQHTGAIGMDLRVAAGSDTCVAVRARDRAGNTSRWSAARCGGVPLDDRALAATGRVSRVIDAHARNRTVSVLAAAGATLASGRQTGRQVAVAVVRGPHQGRVRVTAGARVLGTVDLAAPVWRRDLVYLPATAGWSAPVRVTSVSGAPARVDAVAVLR